MTTLAHADRIMAAKSGTWLMACAPVQVTNMNKGGVIDLPIGARVRITCSAGLTAFALTDAAQSIAFGMEDAAAFELSPPA
jgi:hypothetical protein